MSRQLLVAMDDSGPARTALDHALAVFPDDDVTVLHAVDDLEAGYAGTPPASAADEVDPAFFDDVRWIADERGRTVETVVREGTAVDAILDHVREEGVDQVIVGSAGRSGVSRALLGSVAEAVARRSPVPVTIVPGGR